MSLPMLTADKANQAVYGLLVFLAAALLCGRHAGLAAALAAGLLKEAADWWGNRRAAHAGQLAAHSVDALDVAATCSLATMCWAALPLIGV